MAVSAYILIQAEVGHAAQVAEATREIEGVERADVAMGPYDVIVLANAETSDQIGSVVVNEVGNITGVERTLLCLVVNI